MFIVSYYVFIILYGSILVYFTNVYDFNQWTDGLWMFLIIIGSMILSFFTQILMLHIIGIFRKNKPIDDKINHRLASSILKLGLHLMRVKVIVTGKENIPNDKFVLVGNHQENYDIIILKPIFDGHIINFIAKEALKKLPVFGKWISILGNIYISRDANRSAAESIVKGIKQYKSGTSMAIFPEGKRSFGNEMIDFKAGAFKLAMKPKADILIATQYDTCTIFKSIPWKRYRVYVHIHPLLKYEEYEGLSSHELSAKVKTIIQEQLDKFKTAVGH
jgi:1-acyl-sn-glycerol-3-phosphate acyltransferase